MVEIYKMEVIVKTEVVIKTTEDNIIHSHPEERIIISNEVEAPKYLSEKRLKMQTLIKIRQTVSEMITKLQEMVKDT